MIHYNIYFDVCSIFIYAFTLWCAFIRKDVRKLQNRIFLAMNVLAIFAALFDILSSIANENTADFQFWQKDLFNYLFLYLHNITPFCFAWYTWALTGMNVKRRKKSFFFFVLPLLLSFIFLTINPFNHLVFYYDTANNYAYARGPLMYGLYADAYIYVVIAFFILLKHWKSIQAAKRFSLIFFMIAGVVSVIYQMMFQDMLVELFFQSLAFLGILFTIENEDEIKDSQTHIYNRKAFADDETAALSSKTPNSIIVVKFPSFSYYSSTFGIYYVTGLIKEISSWLDSLQKEQGAYQVSDDAVVLIVYPDRGKKTDEIVREIAERFKKDWTFDEISIIIQVQIRVGKIPQDADTVERMMEIINAPYVRPDNVSDIVHSKDMASFHRKNEVTNALDNAIRDRTFKIHYQPIYNTQKKTVESAEALLRLNCPELGSVGPDEFIPVAESNGSIIEIGAFVLEEVCRFYQEKHLDKLGIAFIQVNLSLVQCMHKGLKDEFLNILAKYGMPVKRICLEITESATSQNPEMVIATIKELKAAGFSFALDDYGTGYSNLSYIMSMPFSFVKIDKSILWGSEKDPKAKVCLENSVRMFKDMGLFPIVEGAETYAQKQELCDIACPYIQGFYFSIALSENEFIDYLKKKPYLKIIQSK
jgi:EAL domain-containing protein (putative c-di-GMP-specific phosphodiesterase class I)/GGDEF domain-containing protein